MKARAFSACQHCLSRFCLNLENRRASEAAGLVCHRFLRTEQAGVTIILGGASGVSAILCFRDLRVWRPQLIGAVLREDAGWGAADGI